MIPTGGADAGAAAAPFRLDQIIPGIGRKMDPRTVKRARRSEIEKRSRQRRKGSVGHMRDELRRLEARFTLLLAEPPSGAPADHHRGVLMTPTEAALLRDRYTRLLHEAQALRAERQQLQDMLDEHQLLHDSWRTLLSDVAEGGCPSRGAHTTAVVHAAFTPMRPDACLAFMRETYGIIARFDEDRDVVTSGSQFMGWTDKRRLDSATSQMHFSFSKSFPGADPVELMRESWTMFCDERAMRRTIFPASVEVHLKTLQLLSDDVVVMHRHTHYVALQRSFHTVYVLFRVRQPRGFMLCFRSIPSPGLRDALAEGEAWIDIFHWLQFVRDDDDEHATTRVSFGGSLGGSVIKFALHWMIELVMTVIRWESACVAPLALVAPS